MKKKKSILSIACLLAVSLVISFSSCKKKTTESPATVTPAKTLNKSTLTNNKTWSSTIPPITHAFFSNGTYGVDGTWAWVKNSDTMDIQYSAGDPKVKWKIYYNTDTEMKCRWINNAQDIVFAIKP